MWAIDGLLEEEGRGPISRGIRRDQGILTQNGESKPTHYGLTSTTMASTRGRNGVENVHIDFDEEVDGLTLFSPRRRRSLDASGENGSANDSQHDDRWMEHEIYDMNDSERINEKLTEEWCKADRDFQQNKENVSCELHIEIGPQQDEGNQFWRCWEWACKEIAPGAKLVAKEMVVLRKRQEQHLGLTPLMMEMEVPSVLSRLSSLRPYSKFDVELFFRKATMPYWKMWENLLLVMPGLDMSTVENDFEGLIKMFKESPNSYAKEDFSEMIIGTMRSNYLLWKENTKTTVTQVSAQHEVDYLNAKHRCETTKAALSVYQISKTELQDFRKYHKLGRRVCIEFHDDGELQALRAFLNTQMKKKSVFPDFYATFLNVVANAGEGNIDFIMPERKTIDVGGLTDRLLMESWGQVFKGKECTHVFERELDSDIFHLSANDCERPFLKAEILTYYAGDRRYEQTDRIYTFACPTTCLYCIHGRLYYVGSEWLCVLRTLESPSMSRLFRWRNGLRTARSTISAYGNVTPSVSKAMTSPRASVEANLTTAGKKALFLSDAAKLIAGVETFIFDLDGVIWKGGKLIERVPETLNLLRTLGKKLLFVTNNSTSSRKQFSVKFEKLGLKISEEEIFSSSFAAAGYLKSIGFPANKKVYIIGEDGIQKELDQAGFRYLGGPEDGEKKIDLEASRNVDYDPDVGAVVVGFDRHINYYKLIYATLCLKKNPGCLFIATNLDSVANLTDAQEWPAGGCMVGAVKASTSMEPTVVGKPATFMMDYLAKKFQTSTEQMCMVGDRLDTDILFGQNGGCKTLLVLSVNLAPEFPVEFAARKQLHQNRQAHPPLRPPFPKHKAAPCEVICQDGYLYFGVHGFEGVTDLETLQSPENFIQPDFYTNQLCDLLTAKG